MITKLVRYSWLKDVKLGEVFRYQGVDYRLIDKDVPKLCGYDSMRASIKVQNMSTNEVTKILLIDAKVKVLM